MVNGVPFVTVAVTDVLVRLQGVLTYRGSCRVERRRNASSEVAMSKLIVSSKPAPIRVMAWGAVIAVCVGLPVIFLLKWFGVEDRFARDVGVIAGIIAGLAYSNTHWPPQMAKD
jgi:hypothetical protein